MKQMFSTGDEKTYTRRVTSEDFASFHGKVVHPVLSTFSLARDAEWTTRLFVIDMRDDDEEGIGTFVNVEHVAPALEGDEVVYVGRVQRIDGNNIVCSVEAHVGAKLIARATTGQKVLPKTKLNKILGRNE
jgi:fluoroacetyl-CoA thioesterase